jgi:hypothetical protein
MRLIHMTLVPLTSGERAALVSHSADFQRSDLDLSMELT